MAAGDCRYVIVGAGSAGCVLANRPSADPACQVALLEAGGPDRKREIRIPAAITKLFLTEYDWNCRTTKQPQLSDRELYSPAGKTLGGSSSINGQAWTSGHRVESGIGDVDHLRAAGVEPRHELVGVGANRGCQREHYLAARVVVHCPKPVTLVAADSTAQLVRFLLARRGMLTSSVNEAVAFVRSDPALAAPDLELVWLPVPLLGGGLTAPPGHGLTLGVELLQPDSRGVEQSTIW